MRVWYGADHDMDGSSDTNGTSADDDGAIFIEVDVAPAAVTCDAPGAVTRFKVVEVTATAQGGLDAPAPVVVRTLRFQ